MTDTDREAFEAWYKKYDRDTQRQYWTRESACWHAWQAARAQPAPITSETGNQAAQGASAITSVPILTDEEIQTVWVEHGLDDCAVEDFARAIESLVRSKLGAGVGWQSIRTAPKDGTHILAVIPDRDTCYVICWVDAAKEIRSYLSVGTAAGWHHAYDGDPIAPHDYPTHWMPLPPPPGIVGKEGGK